MWFKNKNKIIQVTIFVLGTWVNMTKKRMDDWLGSKNVHMEIVAYGILYRNKNFWFIIFVKKQATLYSLLKQQAMSDINQIYRIFLKLLLPVLLPFQ